MHGDKRPRRFVAVTHTCSSNKNDVNTKKKKMKMCSHFELISVSGKNIHFKFVVSLHIFQTLMLHIRLKCGLFKNHVNL